LSKANAVTFFLAASASCKNRRATSSGNAFGLPMAVLNAGPIVLESSSAATISSPLSKFLLPASSR